ncbi:hypothetical protein LTS08_003488 [Lithohypha guttulata]|nr:hypothetical protein LTS08_003488 [Lithohypha guttulata]
MYFVGLTLVHELLHPRDLGSIFYGPSNKANVPCSTTIDDVVFVSPTTGLFIQTYGPWVSQELRRAHPEWCTHSVEPYVWFLSEEFWNWRTGRLEEWEDTPMTSDLFWNWMEHLNEDLEGVQEMFEAEEAKISVPCVTDILQAIWTFVYLVILMQIGLLLLCEQDLWWQQHIFRVKESDMLSWAQLPHSKSAPARKLRILDFPAGQDMEKLTI